MLACVGCFSVAMGGTCCTLTYRATSIHMKYTAREIRHRVR